MSSGFTGSGAGDGGASPGIAAAVTGHVAGLLTGRPPAEIETRVRRAGDLMREQGITFNLSGDADAGEHILPFDLWPEVIGPEDWARIEAGVRQRVRTWEALMRDVYGPQEIVKAGVLPVDLVLADRRFKRECVGLRPLHEVWLHTAAVDLIRGAHGRWMVLEDHLSNATGAAYAVQARRVLAQVFPELLEGQAILPVHDYPTRLLETLMAVSPTGRTTARVVLLSAGVEDEAFYEHATLARQMGIPLVQGGDLVVRDHHVYHKTISGLERVEVIYRRIETEWSDPVVFRGDSRLGVPGLVSSVRKGTVAVANALGTGFADNRALGAYFGQLTDFYLGEAPLLPSVPVHSCRDVDVREQVFESWDRWVIKRSSGRGPHSVVMGASLDPAQRAALRREIETVPAGFVVQPRVAFASVPTWSGGGWEPRPAGIRVFTLQNGSVRVEPAVLTRVAMQEGVLVLSTGRGGGVKDTWIPGEEPEQTAPVGAGRIGGARRMALGSRAADSLYWIGRYVERAEHTVRLLRVVQQVTLEAGSLPDGELIGVVPDVLAIATGHRARFFRRSIFNHGAGLSRYVMLDPRNVASVLGCLQATRHNARQVREALPPEVWSVLNSLTLDLAGEGERRRDASTRARLLSMSLQDEVIQRLDELAGALEKHMLHNDAWHLWQMGRHVERGLFTVIVLRETFAPRDVPAAWWPDEDVLDALLRMVAGQYAYRSSYHARPEAVSVARLLVQDAEFPRSVVFCLEAVQASLRRAFGERAGRETPLHRCQHLHSELLFADLRQHLPAGGQPAAARRRACARWLDGVAERLRGLSTRITDHYHGLQGGAA